MSSVVSCDQRVCSNTTTWEPLCSEIPRSQPVPHSRPPSALEWQWDDWGPKGAAFAPVPTQAGMTLTVCVCARLTNFSPWLYVSSAVDLHSFRTLPGTVRQSSRQTWGSRSIGLRPEDLIMNWSSPSLTSHEHLASSFSWASVYSPVKHEYHTELSLS